MLWYELQNVKKSDSKQVSVDVRVPSDSPWFCGHFPGEPILPGVAQLGMVFDAINESDDQNLRISTISRVRFKKMIRPNDRLRITATPQQGHTESYSFRIMVEGELVCSGQMRVERKGERGIF